MFMNIAAACFLVVDFLWAGFPFKLASLGVDLGWFDLLLLLLLHHLPFQACKLWVGFASPPPPPPPPPPALGLQHNAVLRPHCKLQSEKDTDMVAAAALIIGCISWWEGMHCCVSQNVSYDVSQVFLKMHLLMGQGCIVANCFSKCFGQSSAAANVFVAKDGNQISRIEMYPQVLQKLTCPLGQSRLSYNGTKIT